jgi:hypothetical protein
MIGHITSKESWMRFVNGELVTLIKEGFLPDGLEPYKTIIVSPDEIVHDNDRRFATIQKKY